MSGDPRLSNTERIVDAEAPGALALPDHAPMTPGDGAVRTRVDEILTAPSLEAVLLRDLRPVIANLDLLIPARYGALLGSTLDALRALPGERRSAPVEALAGLLVEERALRDMLDRYRNVLLKG